MTARMQGDTLRMSLGAGLRDGSKVNVAWPSRTRPQAVIVDGRETTEFDAGGIALARPFSVLEARW